MIEPEPKTSSDKEETKPRSKVPKNKFKIPRMEKKLKKKNKNENRSKMLNLKHSIVEWSLLTKFDCFSKIFEYDSIILKLI